MCLSCTYFLSVSITIVLHILNSTIKTALNLPVSTVSAQLISTLIFFFWKWNLTFQFSKHKKSEKTCWQRKRKDDILIEHCSKGQWGSSLKTEQEIDTLQETTNVNKFMQERQRKAVTIEELIKWRVWSWLRINAGGVPNTCKSIDRSPACWTEIEANGWVIRKQPAHEDRDNPWKLSLIHILRAHETW